MTEKKKGAEGVGDEMETATAPEAPGAVAYHGPDWNSGQNADSSATTRTQAPEYVLGTTDAGREEVGGDVSSEPEEEERGMVAEPEPSGDASAFGSDAREADALWNSLRTEKKEREEEEEELDQEADDEAENEAFALDGEGPGEDVAESRAKPVKQKKVKPPKTGPFDGKILGPVLYSRPAMVNEDGLLVPTPPTMFSRLFTFFSLIPILLPLALLAAQVVFTLDVRALWYSDEVRYADAYRNMVSTSNWLVLHMNGAVYPDKPPLFFWFLYGLQEAASLVLPGGLKQPLLFFVGVAVSGLLCLVATHLLAAFVGRVDRRTVLCADLVLISGLFFAGLLHYLRMDLLFTALITFSHVFLFHALVRKRAPGLMLLGFLFAGAAVLTKGPLGFVLPLLAALCFLIWQGRILRVFRLDFIFGILIGLAFPAAWLALAYMELGDSFLNNILHKQILARALQTWHHAEPWYHYLMAFPLMWLPWTFLLLFLPWGRLFGKGMREGLKRSRTPDGAGIAYLWCAFLPGLVLLSAVSIKLPIYCLPLFPPLAVITARALLQMRPLATTCYQYFMALFMALLGVSLILLPMVPKELYHLPILPKATMILGGVCLVFACCMAFLAKPSRSEGMVLLTALFTTAFSIPAWYMTAPSLDVFLSPKAQAEVIKKYREAGYATASVKVYPGTYSYYGGNVKDFDSLEKALEAVGKNPKAILAVRGSDWARTQNKPEGFAVVDRQIIAEREYMLVARPPIGGVKEMPPARPARPAVEETAQEATAATPPAAPVEQPAPAGASSAEQPATEQPASQPEAETTPAGEVEPKPQDPAAPATPAQ